jgi:2-iminobutanoate/2-iminopropanoate deaminase
MKRPVATEKAPRAIGPYTQAIEAGGFVWVSGQIPLDPSTGAIVDGGIEVQATRALENVRAILEAAGTSFDRAVKVVVYLADFGDFEAMNRVYATFFQGTPPARATVEVSKLPRGARIEIDVVALSGTGS